MAYTIMNMDKKQWTKEMHEGVFFITSPYNIFNICANYLDPIS